MSVVVAVIGPQGDGKSWFINQLVSPDGIPLMESSGVGGFRGVTLIPCLILHDPSLPDDTLIVDGRRIPKQPLKGVQEVRGNFPRLGTVSLLDLPGIEPHPYDQETVEALARRRISIDVALFFQECGRREFGFADSINYACRLGLFSRGSPVFHLAFCYNNKTPEPITRRPVRTDYLLEHALRTALRLTPTTCIGNDNEVDIASMDVERLSQLFCSPVSTLYIPCNRAQPVGWETFLDNVVAARGVMVPARVLPELHPQAVNDPVTPALYISSASSRTEHRTPSLKCEVDNRDALNAWLGRDPSPGLRVCVVFLPKGRVKVHVTPEASRAVMGRVVVGHYRGCH